MHTPPDPYVPGAQGAATQTLAPARDVLPAVHAMHVADELAPAAAEYLPSAHALHTLPVYPSALMTEYFPATQFMHAAEELAAYPSLDLPASQTVHAPIELAPVTTEYLPA